MRIVDLFAGSVVGFGFKGTQIFADGRDVSLLAVT